MGDWTCEPSRIVPQRQQQASRCELTHHKCREMGFEKIGWFPNWIRYENMDEVRTELDQLAPIFNSGCSSELQPLMCSALLSVTQPCQDVCMRVWKSCRHQSGSLLVNRPRVLTCRRYPKHEYCERGM